MIRLIIDLSLSGWTAGPSLGGGKGQEHHPEGQRGGSTRHSKRPQITFAFQVVFAPGQSIESNLKNLAERRTDIFGVGDEAASEAMIGQKMGEEEVRPQRIMLSENLTLLEGPRA